MGAKRNTQDNQTLVGILISLIFLFVEGIFLTIVIHTNLLSTKYILIVLAVLLVFLVIVFLLVRRWKKKKLFLAGIIVALLFSAILGAASFYLFRTYSVLDNITKVRNVQTAEVEIYVKNEDGAQTLADISGYKFGILQSLDRENTDQAIAQIDEELGTTVETQEYAGIAQLADGLRNGECGAIVLNNAYLGVLDDMDDYSTFTSEIRSISTQTVEKEIETTTSAIDMDDSTGAAAGENGEATTYTVYISGIDTRGGMTASSLSDVNIIATFNTETKQLLLVSTPRDFYVPLSISNGQKDKLTHAGIYGIDVCVGTMEMLYDVNIPYYFRLNFGGFVKIIDALGGITVNSDYEFDSQNVKGYHFYQGENQMDGEAALVFCRERYSFAEGDRQRGRNQMAVIKGVVNKVLTPAILTNYLSILDSLNDCFETSIPYDVLSGLVRNQLDEGGNWEILSYSVNGTGDTQVPYSMSQAAYVMVPDETTVEKAKTLMEKVRNGETITQAEIDAE